MSDAIRSARMYAYENPRAEVQALVPATARRILDLGCSSGALGAALKQRQDVEIVGVEYDPEYAEAARARLDEVHTGDLETFFDSGVELGRFDCIICADVLEHLREPWDVLAAAVEHLEPGGTVVVSLPNIRYWHTFWMLGVRKTFPRTDFGIFDRTHLRFFTVHDAQAMVESAGLRVTEIAPQFRLRPDRHDDPVPALLKRRPFRSFVAFQYVISATRG